MSDLVSSGIALNRFEYLGKTKDKNSVVFLIISFPPFSGSGKVGAVDKNQLLDTKEWRDDLQELKRGNLLLEREKLNLEIRMLRMKMAKLEP